MTRSFFVFVSLTILSGCSSVTQVSQNPIQEESSKETDFVGRIIDQEEKSHGIPSGVLKSIAKVESGNDPYAVNACKKAHHFKTKASAVSFVNESVNKGYKNISIGCLQLHYASHRKNFSSVDDMLTPDRNIAYGAGLLKALYQKYGSWEKAIKAYHSGKAGKGKAYYAKVMRIYNSHSKLG